MFDNKKKKDKEIEVYSKICGVNGCNNKTEVNIKSRGVTRCAKHFSQDLSDHKAGKRTPNITGRFKAQKEIMDTLKKPDLIQGQNETIAEFGRRCREYSLQTQAGLLPASLKRKSGARPAQS